VRVARSKIILLITLTIDKRRKIRKREQPTYRKKGAESLSCHGDLVEECEVNPERALSINAIQEQASIVLREVDAADDLDGTEYKQQGNVPR
jgi:hypothetical protein